MKYLMRFNENNKEALAFELEEIKEYANAHLAYLLDKGFGVQVVRTKSYTFSIRIYSESGRDYKWGDVKEQVIPFIEIINDTYRLVNLFIGSPKKSTMRSLITSVVEDKIDDNKRLPNITIFISPKYETSKKI